MPVLLTQVAFNTCRLDLLQKINAMTVLWNNTVHNFNKKKERKNENENELKSNNILTFVILSNSKHLHKEMEFKKTNSIL